MAGFLNGIQKELIRSKKDMYLVVGSSIDRRQAVSTNRETFRNIGSKDTALPKSS
jgi:hypothetical protein